MARQGWTSSAIRDEELASLIDFCRRYDSRLPETPSFIDVVRSLRKLAGREIRQGDRNGNNDGPRAENRTVQQEGSSPEKPVATRSYPREPETASPVLAQKITLEREKSRTLYWKAVTTGKIVLPPKLNRTSPAEPRKRFVCKLHQTIHDDGPCAELLQIQRETNLPLEKVGKFSEGGGFVS